MRGYNCATGCNYVGIDAGNFLKHLAQCTHVADWIKEWASKMVAQKDWSRRVGLG